MGFCEKKYHLIVAVLLASTATAEHLPGVPRGGGFPLQKELAEIPTRIVGASAAAGRAVAGTFNGVRRRLPGQVQEVVPEVEIVVHESFYMKYGGIAAVFGGFVVHMVLGTLYCWGNFIAYAPDYLQYFNPEGAKGTPDALGVVPLIIVFQTIGLPFGAELARAYGQRFASILGPLTVALGVFLSSYARKLSVFMVLYGALFGFGVGIGYTAPMSAGWSWFPGRRGLVNGLVLLGFGSGGFLFNLVGSKLANPTGLSPPYPQSVADNFPVMLRKLAACYAVAAVVGGALVRPKPGLIKKVNGEAPSVKVLKAVKSKTFVNLYLIIALTASAGLTSASIYKLFASAAFSDDNFLAATGALGALSNGLGRLFWASTVDVVGFKKPFAAMLILQALNTALTPAAAASGSQPLFLLSTCLAFFCLGGTFSMAPTCCAMAFGPNNAAKIYSWLFSSFAIASLGGVQLAKKLVPVFGWTPVYQILAGMSAVPLLLLANIRVN